MENLGSFSYMSSSSSSSDAAIEETRLEEITPRQAFSGLDNALEYFESKEMNEEAEQVRKLMEKVKSQFH